MENPKNNVVETLVAATNVLVTVSSNPSIDQLAACIGLTLVLNRLGKHATAVFSGEVPSTLEFLKPEQTLEKNTDSLRDFIISLDKSKADKLRYKVEDKLVRIFITPYRTSISDKDLEFSQGDFNVDAVVGLGVMERDQLDQAIVAHGRILHDAKIISLNTVEGSNLGTLGWVETGASSLSEMVVALSKDFKDFVFDPQMATALLTGIVAETDRFSNDKTSSTTMALSSELMAAGANQQLVATRLQGDDSVPITNPSPNGDIQINHGEAPDENPDQPVGAGAETPVDESSSEASSDDAPAAEPSPEANPESPAGEPTQEPGAEPKPNATVADSSSPSDPPLPNLDAPTDTPAEALAADSDLPDITLPLNMPQPDGTRKKVIQPLGNAPPTVGQTEATSLVVPAIPPEHSSGPMTQVSSSLPIMDHQDSPATGDATPPANQDVLQLPVLPTQPSEPANASPNAQPAANPAPPTPDVTDARSAVEQAIQNLPATPEPTASLNALPIDLQPPANSLGPLDQSGLPPLDGGLPPLDGGLPPLPPLDGGLPPLPPLDGSLPPLSPLDNGLPPLPPVGLPGASSTEPPVNDPLAAFDPLAPPAGDLPPALPPLPPLDGGLPPLPPIDAGLPPLDAAPPAPGLPPDLTTGSAQGATPPPLPPPLPGPPPS